MPAQTLTAATITPVQLGELQKNKVAQTNQNYNNETQLEIPVIDLAPLFDEPASPEKRQAIVSQLAEAAENWGFFQLLNHGLSLELMDRTFAVSKEFFSLPLQEKVKAQPAPGASPVATGFVHEDYTKGVRDPKEHLLFFTEGSATKVEHPFSQYNVWPEKPEHFRSVVDELIKEAEKMGIFVMGLVSESLGLPTNFIHEHYQEKTNAFSVFCYPPSPDSAHGFPQHKDGNIMTLLAQESVSGLQVLKGNEWVPVKPIKGALLINVGDVLQVWSNDKYKSVTHRVVNNKATSRFSFAFFCTPGMQTNITPLSQFTTDISQPPRYRTFQYKDYVMKRFQNKKNMSKDVEDVGVDIYAI